MVRNGFWCWPTFINLNFHKICMNMYTTHDMVHIVNLPLRQLVLDVFAVFIQPCEIFKGSIKVLKILCWEQLNPVMSYKYIIDEERCRSPRLIFHQLLEDSWGSIPAKMSYDYTQRIPGVLLWRLYTSCLPPFFYLPLTKLQINST